MKHIIITRLMYREKDLLLIRLKLMREILITCLKEQTNKNFIFCIMMYNEDIELVKSIIDDFDFISFESYLLLKTYVIDNNFNIQTRHDSDDYMSNDYVDKIQNECNKYITNYDIFLLQFQPEKIEYYTKKMLPQPQYNNKMISGFVTLCQKNIKYTCYEKSHINMYLLTDNIFKFPEGYVIYYIHGINDSLIPRDERILKWKFNNQ